MRQNTDKKAQITVFVILAIAIVSIILIIFLPKIQKFIAGPIPDVEIDNCLKENVQEVMEEVLLKGGSIDPTAYYLYNNITIEYLCYTSGWYERCVMQKPLLIQSIEAEITKKTQEQVAECVDDVESELKAKGFNVRSSGNNTVKVDIVPEAVIVSLSKDITISKGETMYNIGLPRVDFDSGAYKMIMIASSILNYEARFGDSDIDDYMFFYSDIKIQKFKQSEGTTIYIITDRDSGEVLQFASRSVPWPPGYVY